jgi:hypothetical protein
MREDLLDPKIRCNVRQHILADEGLTNEPETTFFFCELDSDLGHVETCVLQNNRGVYVREQQLYDITYPYCPYEAEVG